jgi:hypothetical protein
MKQKNTMKGVGPDMGARADKGDTGIKFIPDDVFKKALAEAVTLHAGLLKKLA